MSAVAIFRRRRFEAKVRQLCAKTAELKGSDDPLDNMLGFQYVPGKGWGGWVPTKPLGARDRMVAADGKDTVDAVVCDLAAAVDKLLADRDRVIARFTSHLDEGLADPPRRMTSGDSLMTANRGGQRRSV
jgi:hypothetical protein